MGTIGIFLGFAVLLVAVWRKYNLILAALVASAVIGLTNGFTLIETWNTYLNTLKRMDVDGYLDLFNEYLTRND